MKFIFCLCLVFVVDAQYREKNEFKNERGVTKEEAQKLLDYHNYYRAQQALGKIPGQPSAADMAALEWDDMLASAAQKWSENCGGPMHDDAGTRGQGQCYSGFSGNNFMKFAFTGWCDDEWNGFNYNQNNFLQGHGHYTQIVTAYTRKVGCGYARCDGHDYARLVCNFYPGGNLQDFPMFVRGKACEKCPYGRSYCMDEALCVRKDQCEGSKSKCECSIDWGRCKKNGGTPDKANCLCKCAEGWTGANCDSKCEDLQYCGAFGKDECRSPNTFLTFYTNKCLKHCDMCDTVDLKKKENRNGLTINVYNTPEEVLKSSSKTGVDSGSGEDPNTKGGSSGGGGGGGNGGSSGGNGGGSSGGNGGGSGGNGGGSSGSCTDSNGSCPGWAKRGECQNNPDWMLKNCKKSCNVCKGSGSSGGNNGGSSGGNNGGSNGGSSGGKGSGGGRSTSNDKFCRDILPQSQCEEFNTNGFCQRDVRSMSYHCRKTCGLCINTTRDCQDDSEGCLTWKHANDVCSSSGKSGCKATCGLC